MLQQPAPVASFKTLTHVGVRVKVADIGANPLDGEAPPYLGLLQAGDADVIGFEPNPYALQRLDAVKGPNETYLPHAVGDGRTHTLNFCSASGMTSLLTPNPAVLSLFHGFTEWGRVVSTEKIRTVRLDDIPETDGIEMIKMDIQGAELMVFKNAIQRLATTLVIHTEAEFLQMYVNQPLFAEVEMFLRKQGFMMHRFYPITSRLVSPMVINGDQHTGIGQVVWSDAILVRDITRLDLLSDEQLLKMSAILHDCYGSVDLVLHLLMEYDARTGGTVATDYFAGLNGGPAASLKRE